MRKWDFLNIPGATVVDPAYKISTYAALADTQRGVVLWSNTFYKTISVVENRIITRGPSPQTEQLQKIRDYSRMLCPEIAQNVQKSILPPSVYDKETKQTSVIAVQQSEFKLKFSAAIYSACQYLLYLRHKIVVFYHRKHVGIGIVVIDHPVRIYRTCDETAVQHVYLIHDLLERLTHYLLVDDTFVLERAVHHAVVIIFENVLDFVPHFRFDCFPFQSLAPCYT